MVRLGSCLRREHSLSTTKLSVASGLSSYRDLVPCFFSAANSAIRLCTNAAGLSCFAGAAGDFFVKRSISARSC